MIGQTVSDGGSFYGRVLSSQLPIGTAVAVRENFPASSAARKALACDAMKMVLLASL